MKPYLTIGMAVHNDFPGIWSTIQSLRISNGPMQEVELIVVDNAPDSKHGKAVGGWMDRVKPGCADARYIPMGEIQGTSAPRQRVFDEAAGEVVMCIDSHIFLQPGTIPRLMKWFRDNPKSMDLVSGPMIMDTQNEMVTHFSERWRGAMEGTWGLAWICKCGKTIIEPLDIVLSDGKVTTRFRKLDESEPADGFGCAYCESSVTCCQWHEHQQKMVNGGWRPLGMNDNDPVFEIPGQGLGLFAARKEAWKAVGGFNPAFREFGGEEMYIHRKFRAKGWKALCIPWLRWLHRFGGDWEENKYQRSVYAKSRNYIMGHNETNRDLKPVYEHFVLGTNNPQPYDRLPQDQWDRLLENPMANTAPVSPPPCNTCGGGNAANQQAPSGELLPEEEARFVELMGQAEHVTLVCKRRWWETLAKKAGCKTIIGVNPGTIPAEIPDTDLLILHSTHQADPTYAELVAFAPHAKRILVRSTQTFGEAGEGGGPGMLYAMRRYMDEHKEWSVIQHSEASWGYSFMSRLDEDKPKLPGMVTMAVNFTKAMAAHVADGFSKTSVVELEARLTRCSWCEKRNEDRCSACGCPIAEKAAMKTSFCPLGRWPKKEKENET